MDTKDFIHQFAEVAARYCAWAESELSDVYDGLRLRTYDIKSPQMLLAELHWAILQLQLPDLEFHAEYEEIIEKSRNQQLKIYPKFAKNLPIVHYWDVFNPLALEDIEPLCNSLADDLADIYHDLKPGLSLYESQHLFEAVWYWRFHFDIHWGQHLVGAQRAIHQYISDQGV